MKGATKKVEEMVQKILADRIAELEVLKTKLEADEEAINAATDAMNAATVSGDVKAYQAAKAVRRDAEDSREMHETRRGALNESPLISKAAYEEAVQAIFGDVEKQNQAARTKLYELSNEMNAAAQEMRETQSYANRVLSQLQNEVYRGADRSINDRTGEHNNFRNEDKRVDLQSTIIWGECAAKHYQYRLHSQDHPEG